jgi:hypothetical protein
MSKVLKIILGLFGLVVVLVLAAVIIIPLVVDPNDYRDDIARAVEEETGRNFEIEGEISLSVFPWLGLEVGRMRLGNPPGFGDGPFAEIGSAGVGAKLMPLLSRRLEVSTLRLDGLRVHLVQLADGSSNWSDLADGKSDSGADSAPRAARRRVPAGAHRRPATDRRRRALRGSPRGQPRRGGVPQAHRRARPARSSRWTRRRRSTAGRRRRHGDDQARRQCPGGRGFRRRHDSRAGAAGRARGGAGVPGGKQSGRARGAEPSRPTWTRRRWRSRSWRPRRPACASYRRLTGTQGSWTRRLLTGRIQLQPFSPRALLERLGEPAPETRLTRPCSTGLRWRAISAPAPNKCSSTACASCSTTPR